MSQTSYRVLSSHSEKLAPSGTIGLDRLPQQVVNKAVRLGFDFNILCIGETGIGKSTLIDTLFKTEFNSSPVTHNQTEVSLHENTYRLKEGNVQLRLTVVDTVGFGDQINKESSYKPIVKYVDKQFERYVLEELKPNRNNLDYHDTRIHACLYFISPTGHSLKVLDLYTMKALDEKVNLIPIIAKADTMSQQDLVSFKASILEEIKSNGISTYNPNENGIGGATHHGGIPYAVIGSREMVVAKNTKVRGRKYPWGVVEVENEKHCDFVRLRDMLIRTSMEDLREKTHSIHYEQYRTVYLEKMPGYEPYVKGKDTKQMLLQTREQEVARERELDRRVAERLEAKEKEWKRIEDKMRAELELERKKYAEELEKIENSRNELNKEVVEFKDLKSQMEQSRTDTLQKMKGKKSSSKIV